MIELLELPRERFPAYREGLIRDYAREKVLAGAWSPKEAPQRSLADVDGLLKDGADTYLYLLRDSLTAEEVGAVWMAVVDSGVGRSVWIYDVEVYERSRRKGYGTRALRAVARKEQPSSARRASSCTSSGTTPPPGRSTRKPATRPRASSCAGGYAGGKPAHLYRPGLVADNISSAPRRNS